MRRQGMHSLGSTTAVAAFIASVAVVLFVVVGGVQ